MTFSTTYDGPTRWQNQGQVFNMTLQDVIDYGYDIGLDDYPVWEDPDPENPTTDAAKRTWLNQRIMEHFIMREIRSETPASFILWLNRTMHEVMPLINPLFEKIWFANYDSLRGGWYEDRRTTSSSRTTDDVDTTETSTTETDETSSETSTDETEDSSTVTGTTASEAYSSTNPRQTMVGKTAANYYDSGTKTSGTSTTTSASEGTSEHTGTGSSSVDTEGTLDRSVSGVGTRAETVTETKSGYDGSMLSWFAEWTRLSMSPLQMLFDRLEPCFCQLVTDHFNVW